MSFACPEVLALKNIFIVTFTLVVEICSELIVSNAKLFEIMTKLNDEIKRGLDKNTNGEATVKCFPTYVRDLPTGKEKGKFLALDLGGTKFRVLLVTLNGDNKDLNKFQMKSQEYEVPQILMKGSGTALFDHIADCLANFTKQNLISDELLSLGFTFSFPLSQNGLTEATLVRWTKGFNCSGVQDKDVVKLLKDAIKRRGDVKVDVCAVLNDTTGTLMSCAWVNPNCRIGLIVGTGTNACYVESLENVGVWDLDYDEPKRVVINTEWGAFGDNGCIDFVITKYDKEIDSKSINPGKQLFEKMISGMYMGELVRLIIVKLVRDGILFGGQGSDKLFQRDNFNTEYISDIERDNIWKLKNCKQILEEKLNLISLKDQDCRDVRYICEVVSRRAAQLAAAGVACLLNKMNEKNVVVAVDGSVYRYHPHFHNMMTETIQRLVNPEIRFNLMLSEDGSGRGAALVAAVAANKN